jgi:uncharacterized protein YhdP
MAPWSEHGLQLSSNLLEETKRLQGQGRVRLWADVKQGQWRGGLADVDLKDLQAQLSPDTPPLALQSLSGRLGLQVHAEGFLAEAHALRFFSEQGLDWPEGNLSLNYTNAQGARPASAHLQATQLDLKSLQALALRLPLGATLSPQLQNALQARDLLGRVTSLNLRWQGDWPHPDIQEVRATVADLGWQPGSQVVAAWGSLPGLDVPGLRGAQLTLVLNASTGRLDVQTGKGSSLWLPGLLEPAEVPLHQLKASVRWARQ